MKSRILLVDDEMAIRFAVRSFLEARGFEVIEAESCAEARTVFAGQGPEAVILDYRLPDGTALDLLRDLKSRDADVPFLVLTAHGSIDLAVAAMKEGADQFLTKPIELEALLAVLIRSLEHQRQHRRQVAARRRRGTQPVDPFLGTSPAIRRLEDQARRVVGAGRPILIQGETGTGKGVLASWLHRNGPRAEEAWVDFNCAGLSRELLESELFGHAKGAFTGAAMAKPGLLEVAHRGTAFLDEIGDLDLQVQPKLLKVLEEGKLRRLGEVQDRWVDVHLVAATHQDLTRLVSEGRFRQDVYFRISTIPLAVPALRSRPEDLPLLSEMLLNGIAAELARPELRLAPAASEALQRYEWPGNVRELRNVLERAVLLSGEDLIDPRHLLFEPSPTTTAPADTSQMTLAEMEKRHIARVLSDEQGHVGRAALRLGVPRSSLYQKLKQFGLRSSEI